MRKFPHNFSWKPEATHERYVLHLRPRTVIRSPVTWKPGLRPHDVKRAPEKLVGFSPAATSSLKILYIPVSETVGKRQGGGQGGDLPAGGPCSSPPPSP